jgi:hypothetical protein
MPEAAMNEDHSPIFRENNIRCSRQIPAMQSEPVAECMQCSADDYFRFCVLAADRSHIPAALLRRVNIHHALLAARREV